MVNWNLYLKIIGSVSLIVLFALLGSVLLITGISYFFCSFLQKLQKDFVKKETISIVPYRKKKNIKNGGAGCPAPPREYHTKLISAQLISLLCM